VGWLRRVFGGRGSDDGDQGQEIGRVDDYFAKVGVVALQLGKPLAVGDRVRVKGHTTDFVQSVKSLEIEHEAVEMARRGEAVGIKVKKKCRRGDRVFKLSD